MLTRLNGGCIDCPSYRTCADAFTDAAVHCYSYRTDADPVQKPSHYMLEGLDIEAIDVIRSVLGDGFAAYCRGNVLKYLIRADHKGRRVEDLRKAAKYIEWEIEAREEERRKDDKEVGRIGEDTILADA